MKGKSHCICNCYCQTFAIVFLQKLCDFKMDLMKWQLNFVSCNFGLKSYLWFQIELALRARSILKSRVWFQTKLHSTQFNYHYITCWRVKKRHISISSVLNYPTDGVQPFQQIDHQYCIWTPDRSLEMKSLSRPLSWSILVSGNQTFV